VDFFSPRPPLPFPPETAAPLPDMMIVYIPYDFDETKALIRFFQVFVSLSFKRENQSDGDDLLVFKLLQPRLNFQGERREESGGTCVELLARQNCRVQFYIQFVVFASAYPTTTTSVSHPPYAVKVGMTGV
jgi:hypothetical protein